MKMEHKPISTSFVEIEVLQDGRLLIIEDYSEYNNSNKSNLYCLNQNMKIEWFLPYINGNQSSMDNYVGFTSNGNRVFANTFSCFRVEIDANKGEIIGSTYTK